MGKASRDKRVWFIVFFFSSSVFCCFGGFVHVLAKLVSRIYITGKQKKKVGVLEVPLNSFR